MKFPCFCELAEMGFLLEAIVLLLMLTTIRPGKYLKWYELNIRESFHK